MGMKNIVNDTKNNGNEPENEPKTDSDGPENSQNGPEKDVDEPENLVAVSQTIYKRRELVLHLLTLNPKISIAETSNTLNVSRNTIKRDLDYFRQQGRLTREGGDKGGKWVVK